MKHAPQLMEQVHDIQAVIGTGFGWLHHSAFWLLEIVDAPAARQWLQLLADGPWLKSVGELTERRDRCEQVAEVGAVAFSFAGLQALGVAERDDFPFASAFRSGMGSPLRARLLRDEARGAWEWSDVAAAPARRATAHILLAGWWKVGTQPTFPPAAGVRLVRRIDGTASSFNAKGHLVEPFGFREGISQPVIFGLKAPRQCDARGQPAPRPSHLDADERVAPGEFIMGYRNEYDELSYCADVQGWPAARGAHFAHNGSYLAVRQIEQHLDAFRRLQQMPLPAAICPAGASLGEKMMGRYYDGSPLDWPGPFPAPDGELTRIRFRVEDEDGFVTPRGSHVRRAHPRDTLGHDVRSGVDASKLHRLLRRGRPYAQGEGEGRKVGTLFIACNTDLERQFEFVFQRWLRNPRFAQLEREDDPFGGNPDPARGGTFTLPGLPTGQRVALEPLTTTVGGGYFFLPGLQAVRFLAQPRPSKG
ncbi:MAG TPA: hypothetical protein VIL30_10850 [Ramlibacter sp.]|jgi:putative iron-dependent peroxidase